VNRHVTLAGPEEDDPAIRGLYHFHDPTKEIDEAGLP